MLKDLLDYKKDNYLTKQKQTLKTKKLLIFGGILDTFNIASFIVDLFNSRNIDFSYIAHKKFIMQRVDEGAIQINGNHYKYNNRNVYPLEEHNLNTDEYTAFIGISLLDFAREELTKYGFSDVQVLDPFSYFHEISYDYFANNFEEFESFYNSLEDSLSKQIMENYFQSRIYGDYKGLMNTANPGYFNKLLTYGNNEVLIDCGAYDGDTALEFIEACPNYAGVYSYEMDIKNLAKLRENAKGKKIVVIPKGVYSKKDTLTFNITHDMCSHITEDKTNNKNKILELEVDSIDNLFYHGNDSIYSKEVATPPPPL
ncbi:FkbM family methyltransferase [Helicobacter muridarum]|uniref:FkbM family methyltransferase n=1 Tax=Helicobacter muridarum TaxID=216 RepID=UPI000CF05142|nr:FkbM family methyltransferase [Helicobacter muridarum]